ncbi:MAG: type VI secretion system tip protein VgrG [Rhodocyclaceae bacterium]|nr:type VI secretion system tip protein VgrG [Rhodocyclaceae bacterium]
MAGSRTYTLSTPLGPDVLLFYRMRAVETLSQVPEIRLECLSEVRAIDIDAILAKSVTVTMRLPDESPREFSGYVTRFAQAGMHGRYHVYHATVRPWLWFLTRTADCRVFQHRTVPEIVREVFADHPSADFADRLTGRYPQRKYCVQYRESDYAFVSRLMEEEGMYHFFEYKGGKNTLVLADSLAAHNPYPGYAQVPFVRPRSIARTEYEHISDWRVEREVRPGRYVYTDYDFQKPDVRLEVSALMQRKHEHADYEVFDFPGEYYDKDIGESLINTRRDESHSRFEMIEARANARGLACGCMFTLSDHPRADQNQEYLVTRTELTCRAEGYESDEPLGASYDCHFHALSAEQQFRPQRVTPRPVVKGLQTAVVTGPAGEEIFTDEWGRVKVQFHWDRYGLRDENSSCWVRVSHPWAGRNFGMMSVPRVGQEVVVEFIEGDPDRPLITGRVYNAGQMPPWELPASKTQTGILSRSSQGGAYDNANAIRFEDKLGEEQLWLHAEKDQLTEVEHDEDKWVGNDRRKTIDRDETTNVHRHRSETVDGNETITIHQNRSETVDQDETIVIHQNRRERVDLNETISIGIDRSEDVGANETVKIGANRSVTIGANKAETVAMAKAETIGLAKALSIGAGYQVSVGAAMNTSVGLSQSEQVGRSKNCSIGESYTVEAGDSITLKVGSSQLVMKADGTIVLSGKDITIKGSGNIRIEAGGTLVHKAGTIHQN